MRISYKIMGTDEDGTVSHDATVTVTAEDEGTYTELTRSITEILNRDAWDFEVVQVDDEGPGEAGDLPEEYGDAIQVATEEEHEPARWPAQGSDPHGMAHADGCVVGVNGACSCGLNQRRARWVLAHLKDQDLVLIDREELDRLRTLAGAGFEGRVR